MPTALADLRDVGRYVARIIADPRTLNKRVHVYSELYAQNRVYEVVEGISGEIIRRDMLCIWAISMGRTCIRTSSMLHLRIM